MVRLHKPPQAFLWLLVLCSAFACNSKKSEEETARTLAARAAAAASFDTLRYDDGELNHPVFRVTPNDTLGVWFTPSRTQACSLVAVQYLFGGVAGGLTGTAQGFIKRAARYPNGGAPLNQLGSTIATFALTPQPIGQTTTASLTRPLAVNDSVDLFIGWVSSLLDTATFPIGLMDSIANFSPPRSYRRSATDDSLVALSGDLGVRAVFKCRSSRTDTGNLTIELRWDKKSTDLDLYLTRPAASDTIYWRKRTNSSGGKLDVDDNDGYGPEKIVQPFDVAAWDSASADTVARVGVYYYGPATGKPTKTSVLFYLNKTHFRTLGPCILRSRSWWNVAEINLKTLALMADSTCDTLATPMLSRRRKR